MKTRSLMENLAHLFAILLAMVLVVNAFFVFMPNIFMLGILFVIIGLSYFFNKPINGKYKLDERDQKINYKAKSYSLIGIVLLVMGIYAIDSFGWFAFTVKHVVFIVFLGAFGLPKLFYWIFQFFGDL